jgi:hypothetical protein
MKRFFLFFAGLSFVATGFAQLKDATNDAFQRGELLTYKAYYDAILTGQVIAGSCTFAVSDENKIINDRSTIHVEAIGKTKGAFNLFYRVLDHYESYIDEKAMVPWLFIRRVDEGGYLIQQDVTFNQNKNVAYFKDVKNGRSSTVTTCTGIQDVLSAIYFCRTYDFSKFTGKEDFGVKFLLDDTVFSTKVIFLGRETINTSLGKIKCLKIKPQVLTGTVFKDPFPVILWVSDDKNKVPVLAQSEILVGTVKLELINYSGLKNPFTALVK